MKQNRPCPLSHKTKEELIEIIRQETSYNMTQAGVDAALDKAMRGKVFLFI